MNFLFVYFGVLLYPPNSKSLFISFCIDRNKDFGEKRYQQFLQLDLQILASSIPGFPLAKDRERGLISKMRTRYKELLEGGNT
jgi:hypothetical protein